jgi:hypothetical protein
MRIKDHGSPEKTKALGRAIPDGWSRGDSVCPLIRGATRVTEPTTCLEALAYGERRTSTGAVGATLRRHSDSEGAGQ